MKKLLKVLKLTLFISVVIGIVCSLILYSKIPFSLCLYIVAVIAFIWLYKESK